MFGMYCLRWSENLTLEVATVKSLQRKLLTRSGKAGTVSHNSFKKIVKVHYLSLLSAMCMNEYISIYSICIYEQ